MAKIKLVFQLLIQHKFKFVLLICSTVLFLFVLFPFDDLGDLVTDQVSKATGNQVFVQFDKMNIGILEPGLQLKNVFLETTSLPPLSAQEITVIPSVDALINRRPGGSVTAHGIFKGDIELNLKSAPKSDLGNERHRIQLTAQKIALADLKDLASLPLTLKGNLNVNASAVADLSFQEQPDSDITLKIEKFELPAGNVNTMMGPITLPEVKLKSLQLKGRLSAGRFQIEEGLIGEEGDELRGNIKGGLGLQLRNSPQGLVPQIGAYDFII